jgi:hypothetical protein
MATPRYSPFIVEIVCPFAPRRAVAVSTDPLDAQLLLQRIAARRRREAKGLLDPATVAVIEAEAEHFDRLLALILVPVRQKNLAEDATA